MTREIYVDGHRMSIKCSFRASIEHNRCFGKSIIDDMSGLTNQSGGIDEEALARLLWTCLKDAENEMPEFDEWCASVDWADVMSPDTLSALIDLLQKSRKTVSHAKKNRRRQTGK